MRAGADVCVTRVAGDIPKRLTYHPSVDEVSGWTPDGKSILFASTRDNFSGNAGLYTLPVAGGELPSTIPFPMAASGWILPDAPVHCLGTASTMAERLEALQRTPNTAIWIAKRTDSRVEKPPSERPGHACVVLTLDTYGQALPGIQKNATTRLALMLYG